MGRLMAESEEKRTPNSLTEHEIEIFTELMNIAFGRAVAELAEFIDIFISLEPPSVEVLPASKLAETVKKEINPVLSCSIIEQQYFGNISGMAFLIFPHGVERELLSLFQKQDVRSLKSDMLIELEKEVLTEIGSILIGACVGKLSELNESPVTYMPPRTIIGENFEEFLLDGSFETDDFIVTLKTNFTFEDRAVSGHLFLVNCQDCIPGLKKSLEKFWNRYA